MPHIKIKETHQRYPVQSQQNPPLPGFWQHICDNLKKENGLVYGRVKSLIKRSAS